MPKVWAVSWGKFGQMKSDYFWYLSVHKTKFRLFHKQSVYNFTIWGYNFILSSDKVPFSWLSCLLPGGIHSLFEYLISILKKRPVFRNFHLILSIFFLQLSVNFQMFLISWHKWFYITFDREFNSSCRDTMYRYFNTLVQLSRSVLRKSCTISLLFNFSIFLYYYVPSIFFDFFG